MTNIKSNPYKIHICQPCYPGMASHRKVLIPELKKNVIS